MIVKVIAVRDNDYTECEFDYLKLTEYPWSLYKNFNRSGTELYSIQLHDSNIKNELATKLIQQSVIGSLLFVKVSRTNIASIDIMDLPELLDDSLMSGINALTMADSDVSDMSTDVRLMKSDITEKIISDSNTTSIVYDPSMGESTPDNKYAECIMDDDDEYYNYNAGYDSC
jgi:hypothetical protein